MVSVNLINLFDHHFKTFTLISDKINQCKFENVSIDARNLIFKKHGLAHGK